MKFNFFMPTKVFFADHALPKNAEVLTSLGNRCLVVTGKHSAKASGALEDISSVLAEQNIDAAIFDQVEENPSLETVKKGSQEARKKKVDFIIGCGGGSPLDAAKAIAALSVNDIDPYELYDTRLKTKPLPIAAVPTTAGTGSEVTPYAVLTNRKSRTKKNYINEKCFPTYAFLDTRYTMSMPYELTVYTAVDAFSHALEGFLTRRSTEISDLLALKAISLFAENCHHLLHGSKITYPAKEMFLYMSLLGGMVIAQAGASIVHSLGYPLTIHASFPHGKANGLLLGEFLRFICPAAPDRIRQLLSVMSLDSIDELDSILKNLLPLDRTFTIQELKKYAQKAITSKSMSYALRRPTEGDLLTILSQSLEASSTSFPTGTT